MRDIIRNWLGMGAFLVSTVASAQSLELTRWRGTDLRGPAADVTRAIRDAHANLVCWADGIETLAPRYEGGVLKQVTLHVRNEACRIEGRDLVFTLTSAGAYKVLALASPAIAQTALAGYPEAELLLSVVDAAASPVTWSGREPLYQFRMILKHKYDYDPGRYGDAVVTYETRHAWRQIARETISSRVVEDPAYCDPRFPRVPCRHTVTVTRRTDENSLTGQRVSADFEEWTRTP